MSLQWKCCRGRNLILPVSRTCTHSYPFSFQILGVCTPSHHAPCCMQSALAPAHAVRWADFMCPGCVFSSVTGSCHMHNGINLGTSGGTLVAPVTSPQTGRPNLSINLMGWGCHVAITFVLAILHSMPTLVSNSSCCIVAQGFLHDTLNGCSYQPIHAPHAQPFPAIAVESSSASC